MICKDCGFDMPAECCVIGNYWDCTSCKAPKKYTSGAYLPEYEGEPPPLGGWYFKDNPHTGMGGVSGEVFIITGGISFDNDVDTGFFCAGDDELKLSVEGTEAVRWGSSKAQIMLPAYDVVKGYKASFSVDLEKGSLDEIFGVIGLCVKEQL